MKKYFFIIIIILSISCEKKPNIITPKAPGDSIVFKVLSPSKIFQTVKFYTLQDHTVCTAMVPTPTDSVVEYQIDFNQDAIKDYSIVVSHHKYTGGYCGHCDKFTYNIFIQGISENALIIADSNLLITKIFKYGDSINIAYNFLDRTELLLLEGCALPFQTDFTSGYIGVQFANYYGYIKI